VTFRILEWRELRKNSLLGFAKVELPSGMILADVTILSGLHGPYALPPSKPMISPSGVVMKDRNGKTRYTPIVDFTTKDVRSKFSASVITALQQSHPKVFE
jgi:hypothetical protein